MLSIESNSCESQSIKITIRLLKQSDINWSSYQICHIKSEYLECMYSKLTYKQSIIYQPVLNLFSSILFCCVSLNIYSFVYCVLCFVYYVSYGEFFMQISTKHLFPILYSNKTDLVGILRSQITIQEINSISL